MRKVLKKIIKKIPTTDNCTIIEELEGEFACFSIVDDEVAKTIKGIEVPAIKAVESNQSLKTNTKTLRSSACSGIKKIGSSNPLQKEIINKRTSDRIKKVKQNISETNDGQASKISSKTSKHCNAVLKRKQIVSEVSTDSDGIKRAKIKHKPDVKNKLGKLVPNEAKPQKYLNKAVLKIKSNKEINGFEQVNRNLVRKVKSKRNNRWTVINKHNISISNEELPQKHVQVPKSKTENVTITSLKVPLLNKKSRKQEIQTTKVIQKDNARRKGTKHLVLVEKIPQDNEDSKSSLSSTRRSKRKELCMSVQVETKQSKKIPEEKFQEPILNSNKKDKSKQGDDIKEIIKDKNNKVIKSSPRLVARSKNNVILSNKKVSRINRLNIKK